MGDLRLAICGAGFWAQFQIAAWRELPGVEIAAIYNRTRDKAEALAARFNIPVVYDDAAAMLREVRPDALDIITDVDITIISCGSRRRTVSRQSARSRSPRRWRRPRRSCATAPGPGCR